MAIVKLGFPRTSLKRAIEYVTKDRADDDVVSALNCNPETAAEQMAATRKFHDKEVKRPIFELIQSFSPEESAARSPHEMHTIARELTEKMFPGYEAVLKTHTDKGHTHTHIRINRVHPETGVLIGNERQWGQFFGPPSKRGSLDAPGAEAFAKVYRESKTPEISNQRMLHVIRGASDTIVRQHELSVIRPQSLAPGVATPGSRQKLDRFRSAPWVLDLMQKATFARALSTHYDEYIGYLAEFNIGARVERKNISYTYPGSADRKIRGKSLGANFDKEGLERNFNHNSLMFSNRPDLRAVIRGEWETLKKHPGTILRDGNDVPREPLGARTLFSRDYNSYRSASRRDSKARSTSELDLSHSILPISEVQKGKGSIFEYCKKHNVAVTLDVKGRHCLKGREHILLTDRTFTNSRNEVYGTLIDFVAIHQNLTYVQSLAKINNNPRLLLLEQHFGTHQRTYNSFYVPKPEQLARGPGAQTLSRFLKSFGANPGSAGSLLERNQAHVSKSGVIRIFGENDKDGAMEFTESKNGGWKGRPLGRPRKPFYKSSSTTRAVHVFADPKDFLAHQSKEGLGHGQSKHGVLALMTPDPEPVDHYLSEHRHVSQVLFVTPKRGLSQADLDFFGILKSRYQHHGISVEHASRGPEHTRGGLELEL